MKTRLFLALFLFLSVAVSAQDTTKVNTGLTVASKNFWRGAVYGDNAPMIQGTLSVSRNNFEVGAYGTTPTSGITNGYGVWMEIFAAYTMGRFTLTVDDYFFFNARDQDNDYFNWNHNSTQHLVESRLTYKTSKFSATGSYVVYAARSSVNAFYFETEYYIIPEFSVLAGFVTGESYLNFYDDGGITHIGVAGNRVIEVTDKFKVPLKAALYASPNHDNIMELPGLRRNPINFVISINL